MIKKRPPKSSLPNWLIPLILAIVAIISGLTLLVRLTNVSLANQSNYLSTVHQTIPRLIHQLNTSLSKLKSLSNQSTYSINTPPLPNNTPSPTSPLLSATSTPQPISKPQHLITPRPQPIKYPTNAIPTLPPFDSIKPWIDLAPGELGSPEWQQEFEKKYKAIKQEIEANRLEIQEKNRQFTDQLTASPFP